MIGGVDWAEAVLARAISFPVGELVPHSNEFLSLSLPESVLEIKGTISKLLSTSAQDLEDLWDFPAAPIKGTVFPCGAGPGSFTVCPDIPGPFVEGDWMVVAQILNAGIPLADDTNFYTYAFVFDSDRDSANDWIAPEGLENDYFQGSDRWYQVHYTPPDNDTFDEPGWFLTVTQVADGAIGFSEPVQSSAVAMISDNSVLLAIPMSEFPARNPTYRVSSFRHTGDFGEEPPHNWSGDFHPQLTASLFFVTGT